MVEVKDLKIASIFRGLSDDELQKLAEVCVEKTYKEGEFVVKQGDTGDELFILKSGECAIDISIGPKATFSIPVAQPGSVFGEICFIDGGVRTGTIRCSKDSVLISLCRRDFDKLIEEHKNIGFIVMRNLNDILANKLRDTDEKFRKFYLEAAVALLRGMGML